MKHSGVKVEYAKKLLDHLASEFLHNNFESESEHFKIALAGSVKLSSHDILNTKDVSQRIKEIQHQLNIFILSLPYQLRYLLENDIEKLKLYQTELFPTLEKKDVEDVAKLAAAAIHNELLLEKHLKKLATLAFAENTLDKVNKNLQNIALSEYFTLLNRFRSIEFEAAIFYVQTNSTLLNDINEDFTKILSREDLLPETKDTIKKLQDSINWTEINNINNRINEIRQLSAQYRKTNNFAGLPKLQVELEQLQQRQEEYIKQVEDSVGSLKEQLPDLKKDLEKIDQRIDITKKINQKRKNDVDIEKSEIKKELEECTSPKEFLNNLIVTNEMLKATLDDIPSEERDVFETLTTDITNIILNIQKNGLDEFHIEQCSRCFEKFLEKPLIHNIAQNNIELSPLVSKLAEMQNKIASLNPQNIEAKSIPQAIPTQKAIPIHQFEPITDIDIVHNDGPAQEAEPVQNSKQLYEANVVQSNEKIQYASSVEIVEPNRASNPQQNIDSFIKRKSQFQKIIANKQTLLSEEVKESLENLNDTIKNIKIKSPFRKMTCFEPLSNSLDTACKSLNNNNIQGAVEAIKKIDQIISENSTAGSNKDFNGLLASWKNINQKILISNNPQVDDNEENSYGIQP